MKFIKILALLLLVSPTFAASELHTTLDLTSHWVGYFSLALFVVAYILVMAEEFTGFSKSKPVILAAGIIWGLIGWVYASEGLPHTAEIVLRHNLLEFAELFLFLLVAMTYIEAMRERKILESLKVWLINKGFTLRQLFWLTGFLAFFISPVADNLTTALIMGAVVLSVGGNNVRFISIAFVNIVVAANAGGAFSPFGDITTLMVWQKGVVEFDQFFALFIPSIVNFLVPAVIMHFAIKNEPSELLENSVVKVKEGGIGVVVLFTLTIATAVSFHNFLHLPPAMGMMMGLGYLMLASFFIRKFRGGECDIFNNLAKAEWDTLLFFFGVILSVGGLGFMGYLAMTSEMMYASLGATYANIVVGVLSAIVDNIPVMFAVLSMNPDMSLGQWLLVTLTTGVGGSLLSVGSAAGVALMGQSKGLYTFVSHLKWMPVIALGYAASILTHLWWSKELFNVSI
ncbi:Na+/H+ antiporter NhaD type [Bathymodiolus heckerae thiotrophic gill symbiont]|uniref:sodium:proton antiporter NhaD n=1 Tax=Bathymodiolus heckerae thiotrophic gill symbiont TaxID=1052212 RepID=UPI0010B4174A|nr:sodium:proton antiporter NhaD [Bathymodiolus heckerae thiotrophic gill symbiont]CAC9439840.1 Na+/H+ antiporter NhaD type [uncultured Gammaproteobacteria bacterium]SMN13004.1 Na+/H+ antiporter NhaD type [Bathymodiolus heckerae thiotrophic gill symbiont]